MQRKTFKTKITNKNIMNTPIKEVHPIILAQRTLHNLYRNCWISQHRLTSYLKELGIPYWELKDFSPDQLRAKYENYDAEVPTKLILRQNTSTENSSNSTAKKRKNSTISEHGRAKKRKITNNHSNSLSENMIHTAPLNNPMNQFFYPVYYLPVSVYPAPVNTTINTTIHNNYNYSLNIAPTTNNLSGNIKTKETSPYSSTGPTLFSSSPNQLNGHQEPEMPRDDFWDELFNGTLNGLDDHLSPKDDDNDFNYPSI